MYYISLKSSVIFGRERQFVLGNPAAYNAGLIST